MKDKLDKELNIGDIVVFAPAGSYAGVSLGFIEKFTPKQVCILSVNKIRGRHMDSKKYYAYSNEILKYE